MTKVGNATEVVLTHADEMAAATFCFHHTKAEEEIALEV